MSTSTRRGRKPSKFYRGRIPNQGIEFLLSQDTEDLSVAQKSYHTKFGHWLKESTIAKTLSRYNKKKSVVLNTTSNKVSISINYKGKSYSPKEYMDMREKEARIDLLKALNNG